VATLPLAYPTVVELLQYALALGRVTSVDDVLLNAAGAGRATLPSQRLLLAARVQLLRRAEISCSLFMLDRPEMPISAARWRSFSTVQSSWSPALPPLRPTLERELLAAAFAIRADFCLLLPSRRRSSYSDLSLTLGPGSALPDLLGQMARIWDLPAPRVQELSDTYSSGSLSSIGTPSTFLAS
jgi:hypothetical protein